MDFEHSLHGGTLAVVEPDHGAPQAKVGVGMAHLPVHDGGLDLRGERACVFSIV